MTDKERADHNFTDAEQYRKDCEAAIVERDQYWNALNVIVAAWTHVRHDEPPCGICIAREAIGVPRW